MFSTSDGQKQHTRPTPATSVVSALHWAIAGDFGAVCVVLGMLRGFCFTLVIAVDALEALGAAAASSDSSAEALRLFAAADRLRNETGYRWRFNAEQQRYDTASRLARDDLDDGAESAWHEGLALDLPHAVAYARRARDERARPRHGWDSLTPTERQVVDLVAGGLTNPEIAERLLMARGTVKTHLEHVYSKTGLRNRAELAAAVTQHKHDQT